MRANIIIHSITGNLLIIGEVLKEKLTERGIDARLYRVEDSDLHLAANKNNDANEYYEDIISLPVATNEKLRKGDAILLGCPAIFGLPTAEMMSFLDGTLPLLENKELENKLFYGFSTTRYGEENGESAITALELWADQMGMAILDTETLVHDDGDIITMRPGITLDKKCETIADAIKEALLE